jgi:hypothetical protein
MPRFLRPTPQRTSCPLPGGRRGPLLCLSLLLVPLLGGCYTMRAVDPASVSPGDEVVVHLGLEASLRLSEQEGYELRSLSGRLESLNATSVVLSTRAGRRVQGIAVDNTRRIFSLDRPEVVLIERREFNRGRSLLAGGAALGAILWAVLEISGDGSGSPDPPGEPGPPTPAIRIPLPLPR